MTDQNRTPGLPVRASTTVGAALQLLLGVALAADLVFLGMVGLQLSNRVEATGVALAAGCAIALGMALCRLTRRIGEPEQAFERG